MRMAKILCALGVLTFIALLSGPVMALAGNDTPLPNKSLSDADLELCAGMGSWTLTQTNVSSGLNNSQSSSVSGFPGVTKPQPFTSTAPPPGVTQTQTVSRHGHH
jgi:hypothetical protein